MLGFIRVDVPVAKWGNLPRDHRAIRAWAGVNSSLYNPLVLLRRKECPGHNTGTLFCAPGMALILEVQVLYGPIGRNR